MSGWGALALAPALGIDTFAVAAGLGMAGQRSGRLALVVAVFEGGMPLLGALVGGWLGRMAFGAAVWAAAVLLGGLGGRALLAGWRELREDDAEQGPEEAAALLRPGLAGWGLLTAALAVSVDELGAGLAAGAAHIPLGVLAPALALQAVVCTYAGTRAGVVVARWLGRYGEISGGVALMAVAATIAMVGR